MKLIINQFEFSKRDKSIFVIYYNKDEILDEKELKILILYAFPSEGRLCEKFPLVSLPFEYSD